MNYLFLPLHLSLSLPFLLNFSFFLSLSQYLSLSLSLSFIIFLSFFLFHNISHSLSIALLALCHLGSLCRSLRKSISGPHSMYSFSVCSLIIDLQKVIHLKRTTSKPFTLNKWCATSIHQGGGGQK